jgi:hypothetical protein
VWRFCGVGGGCRVENGECFVGGEVALFWWVCWGLWKLRGLVWIEGRQRTRRISSRVALSIVREKGGVLFLHLHPHLLRHQLQRTFLFAIPNRTNPKLHPSQRSPLYYLQDNHASQHPFLRHYRPHIPHRKCGRHPPALHHRDPLLHLLQLHHQLHQR